MALFYDVDLTFFSFQFPLQHISQLHRPGLLRGEWQPQSTMMTLTEVCWVMVRVLYEEALLFSIERVLVLSATFWMPVEEQPGTNSFEERAQWSVFFYFS